MERRLADALGQLVSEAISALLRPLLLAIDAVDGLGVLILDVYAARRVLDRHIHIDHLDEKLAFLIGNL